MNSVFLHSGNGARSSGTVFVFTVIVATGICAVLLAGCDDNPTEDSESWPPVSSALHQEFSSKQQGLEALSTAVAKSDFSSVYQWGDAAIAAYEIDNEDDAKIDIENPDVWNALFDAAGVDTATNYRGEIWLNKRFEVAGTVDDTVYDYTFVKSDESEANNCLPRYAEAECGACVERIDEHWHLFLLWYPSEWLADFDGLDDGDTERFNELNKEMQFKMQTCMEQFYDEQ